MNVTAFSLNVIRDWMYITFNKGMIVDISLTWLEFIDLQSSWKLSTEEQKWQASKYSEKSLLHNSWVYINCKCILRICPKDIASWSLNSTESKWTRLCIWNKIFPAYKTKYWSEFTLLHIRHFCSLNRVCLQNLKIYVLL